MQTTPVAVTPPLYWTAIGLFSLLFSGSVVLGLVDLNGSYIEFQRLGFPVWSFYFLTVAKVLGLVAIISNRSQTLKDFAFAGFLFDLLLALGSHISKQEIQVLLPSIGLVLWAFAFVMDRKRFPARF